MWVEIVAVDAGTPLVIADRNGALARA